MPSLSGPQPRSISKTPLFKPVDTETRRSPNRDADGNATPRSKPGFTATVGWFCPVGKEE
jgi:hypothetical protein